MRTVSMALVCALAVLLSVPPAVAECRRSDVVVVGAGLGGLAAAAAVKAAGRSVVVLESRERIAGRLNSVNSGWKTPKGDDIVLDMGGSWIHGLKGNPMTKLAQQADLRLYYTPVDAKTQYIYGKDREPTAKEQAAIDDGYETLVEAVEEVALEVAGGKNIAADQSLQEVGFEAADEVKQDGNRADTEQLLGVKLGVSFIENEAGGDKHIISAGTYPTINETLLGLNSFELDPTWAIMPQGFANTARPLARGLNIRFGDAAKVVKYAKGGVRVKTASGKAYCAKRAVVAVPLGVLKKGNIRFEPNLPRSQKKVFSKIAQGHYHKLFMLFDKPFWDTKATWIVRVPTKVPGQSDWKPVQYRNWMQYVNLVGAYDGAAVLLALNNGQYAQTLDSMTPKQVIKEATAALRYMYGDDTPAPKAYHMTNWSNDPHTFGSYPYWAEGVPVEIDNTVHVSERIFWAGDWVDGPIDIGYTHGAVMKGRKAAKLLLSTL